MKEMKQIFAIIVASIFVFLFVITTCLRPANAGLKAVATPVFAASSFTKLSAAPSTAPGAGLCVQFFVAGTNATTCKLQSMCGTSTTPVTIVDNIGGGC